ncbi:hypothetical protein DOTSEDRAFT_48995 [Dothistroma septosporum NZE10]|uniref:Uncharacterized protein n=1 Tax=Dothistroma septosporum (strain NZE10 / CBS 128990) TaxID=675120 RepID=N1PYN0_DOTSN|nr:hypothetical protein DOTSEDRAFT_48995 [Dothistroma septosporum NZE10]
MKGLARHTAALDLPEDATQSMTLPDSDSEDNLDGSSPVMRPVNEGKDDGMPVPPPLVITTTIPEVNADEQSAAESGAESSTSIADDISEALRNKAPDIQPPVAYAKSPDFVGDVHRLTFHGPGGIDEATATATELLDEEEKFLIGHLDSLAARSVLLSAVRRVQHLLAVWASFRGDWDEAITRFMKVLRLRFKRVVDIDDGDCAAAHWLGDLYAMQNRRAEAHLAYFVAERSPFFNRSDPSFRLAIQAEQSTVQNGVSKADFKHYWSPGGQSADATSVLDEDIITLAVAKQVLAPWSKAFEDSAALIETSSITVAVARPTH